MAAIEVTAAQAKPQTGAELLVRALELERVEYVFGVPGEENLDLLEAIRTSSIKSRMRSRELVIR